MRRRTTMNDDNKTVYRGGVGIFGWLFLILFVLKLNPGGNFTTPVADWSWWWVTAPLWAPFVLFVFIFMIVITVIVIRDK